MSSLNKTRRRSAKEYQVPIESFSTSPHVCQYWLNYRAYAWRSDFRSCNKLSKAIWWHSMAREVSIFSPKHFERYVPHLRCAWCFLWPRRSEFSPTTMSSATNPSRRTSNSLIKKTSASPFGDESHLPSVLSLAKERNPLTKSTNPFSTMTAKRIVCQLCHQFTDPKSV